MSNWIKNNQNKIAIAILVALTIITFIPLSYKTGYYLNDWHPLAGKLSGVSLYSMWSHERVGVGFLFSLTYPIIQDSYFGWQLFTISMRLIGALGFYWLLSLIVENKTFFKLSAAAIFLIYPGFLQQPIALTFSNHYIGYNLVIFSLVFTVIALLTKQKTKKYLFTGLSILFQLGYLLDYEYMIGYEAVRFVLVWYLSSEDCKINLKAFWNTILKDMPYIIGTGAFLFWRVFIFKSTRPTTNMGLLARKYLNDPFGMAAKLILETLRDFIETVWQSWSVPFFQTASNIDGQQIIISVILALIAVALYLAFVWKGGFEAGDKNIESKREYAYLVWIGLIAVFAALFPVIASDREVKYNWQMDRYTLHVTFGVALLLAGLIFRFIQTEARKIVVSFLILVAVITHYNNTAAYVKWWDYERTLWWQLSWRAPDLVDGTQVIPLLPYGNRLQEGVEAWTPINAIYRSENTGDPSITADVINSENMLEIYTQSRTDKSLRGIGYVNDFTHPLLISYPSGGSCAHVIDSERPELSFFEEDIIYRAAPFSQIDQIIIDAEPHLPPSSIFGPEPEHGWCYYYQKVSLYRQQENWDEAHKLASTVLEQEIAPTDRSEWLPFLETFIEVGDEENAKRVAQIVKEDRYASKNLCGYWIYEYPHLNQALMDMLCSDFAQ